MTSKRTSHQYVVCVRNDGYQASLVVRRIYRALPDAEASKRKLVRVVDESGEDYLYPEAFFSTIELPPAVKKAFATS